MNMFLRTLPLGLSGLLWAFIVLFWPHTDETSLQLIPWVNIALMFILASILSAYGIRLLWEKDESSPGSRLRAKLVIGMVGMLLIPAGAIQMAANQMVDKGMTVWFDVRVDTLLDRALNLAQGFYGQINQDLTHNLLLVMNNDTLRSEIATLPLSFGLLNSHFNEIMDEKGWQSLKYYDRNERLIAAVQSEGLSRLDSEKLSEQAKLAMTLGKITSETITDESGENVFAYAPIIVHQNAVGVLQASIRLPAGFVENARAVEADYSSYRKLERHRQSIRDTFTHVMLLVTLLVVILVGMVALGFSRRLTAPIGNLAYALKRITEGNLNTTIHTAPNDELGSLVHSFNRMSERLHENVTALEKTKTELTQTLSASQQRQTILETLLDNLQSGVILLHANGEILLINQALFQILDTPALQSKEIRHISHLTAASSLQAVAAFHEELLHHPSGTLQQEIELTIRHKPRQILARGVHIQGSNPDATSDILLLLDDVSQLADAQRHRAWAEVAQRLAHEIKNPLTPIKLSTERIQKRFRKQVDNLEIFDRCTDAIITQVERLQRLISDFTTLARLPQPSCDSVPSYIFIKEINDLYNSYKQLQVEFPDAEVFCWCDADQVRQVLINLVENALSSTQINLKPVRFYLSYDAQWVHFHIEDMGDGIPDELADHIFEAYFSTKSDGSGLGLSIARRIADEHGGELQLLSNRQPTHFCLSIPIKQTTMEPI
ncbi:MAG: PAS domain-containing sensor histidine kinase [Zetaproteobacteria bacterium CG_4_9_14_3_um_filter_49_83]|nr:MAG: PAS domain-containing sensor histidine kinase [Zetaproteobacteria bacterium CG1_02_49_23]PIQ31354.1 MAG: PAS domain-containing sensor histidine kinase [Zetaproteobacteria bacterium CG17_big_fil_post_rev_8_21_14_2_50_50_13]PIY55384.1 MAG: PAS domain-containing sensor histidine kinase [Zetaproteobacteria bacterium CG_4_10_14_0_8_um_filter_49_80]PJA34924.1 MAG: PAS domain-containing sensor histidine kinase [Zetaproteobacteria bacterium CG_4_9_14_3_um_filter_49_83]